MSEPLAEGAGAEPPYARMVYYTPVRQYPGVADGKATALLGAFGLILSAMLFVSRPLGEIVRRAPLWEGALVMMALAPLAFLVLAGLYFALRTLTLPTPPMPPTPAFFQHLAATEGEEYRKQVRAMGHKQALRALMEYHHAMSVLCAAKFFIVEKSVRCLRGAFFLWLLLMLRLILPSH